MNDVSNNSEYSENIENPENTEESSFHETTENSEYSYNIVVDSFDYTQNLENIQTILIFISALLVAYGLAFAFFKGFKR